MNARNRRKLNTLLVVGLFIIFLLCMTVTRPLVASAASGSTTVYVTDYGEKYHRSNCQYLHDSKHSISLSSAVNQGYTPCSVCNPPRLTSGGGGTTNPTPSYPSSNTRNDDDERWIPIFWAVVIAVGGGGYITYSIIKDRRERKALEEQDIEEDDKED